MATQTHAEGWGEGWLPIRARLGVATPKTAIIAEVAMDCAPCDTGGVHMTQCIIITIDSAPSSLDACGEASRPCEILLVNLRCSLTEQRRALRPRSWQTTPQSPALAERAADPAVHGPLNPHFPRTAITVPLLGVLVASTACSCERAHVKVRARGPRGRPARRGPHRSTLAYGVQPPVFFTANPPSELNRPPEICGVFQVAALNCPSARMTK